MLTGEELLAGGCLDFEIDIPKSILDPGGKNSAQLSNKVRLKPLTVHDLQLVTRAAKSNDTLVASLMVQRALVDPELSVVEVNAMHVGLLQFLLDKVNALSGISASTDELDHAAEAPIAKAAFILAKEFGWTPQQVGDMTIGQVLLNLQMLRDGNRVAE